MTLSNGEEKRGTREISPPAGGFRGAKKEMPIN